MHITRHRLNVWRGVAAVCGILWTGAASGGDGADSGGIFRAGAAISNITPWLGLSINGNMQDAKAAKVHDELHARCLVLDDGSTRLAIVVCDSCVIPRPIHDATKTLIQQRLGLNPDHVLISATHTHSAPASGALFQSEPDAEYTRFLSVRIADGVARAISNLEPARIGWGTGQVPGEVFNRRWKMKPGVALPNPFGGMDKVKMNPPVGSTNLLEPAGPTDPGVSVVSIQSTNGRPIAVLANYSLHYVGGVPADTISADYYGAFAERVSQLLGAEHEDPSFVAIMSNGTSGNVNNINFRERQPQQPPFGKIKIVADELAHEVCGIMKGAAYRDWVRLDARHKEISLHVRKPDAPEIERAQAILDKAGNRELSSLDEIYAHETMKMRDYPDEVELVLEVFRIGELGIVSVPCEVFAETGLEIKAHSPLHPTFTIELANGYNGYLPTPEQFELGGYETWRGRGSYLEENAAPKIYSTVLELLRELAQP